MFMESKENFIVNKEYEAVILKSKPNKSSKKCAGELFCSKKMVKKK